MATTCVLIADDHEIVRAGFRRLIDQMEGLSICGEIGDGLALSSFLENNHVDLLLVDLTMPNFEPISAIAAIKEKYAHIKILVVSAYDDRLYVKKLLEIGVNGYHLKDEPLQTLQSAIQRVLQGERWISGSLIDKLLENDYDESTIPEFTDRQLSMLRYLHLGFENKKIASKLDISIKTVESHLTNIYRKLDVQSRLEVVNFINQYPELLGIKGEQIASKEKPSPITRNAQLSVLVLDDNSRFRKQLLHMISKAHDSVNLYEAETIDEALQLVKIVKFQLAFVDVILRNEDGITASHKISRISPGTRIILISAYPDREFHRQGLNAGAKAFLDKKNLDLSTIKLVIADVI